MCKFGGSKKNETLEKRWAWQWHSVHAGGGGEVFGSSLNDLSCLLRDVLPDERKGKAERKAAHINLHKITSCS